MSIESLSSVIERVYTLAGTVMDPARKTSGEWSAIEIIGHLVDSAGNNIQRLLRYRPQDDYTFPAYDQELFVKRAGYQEFDYNTLLSLWYNLNKLFLHIYANIPESDRKSRVRVGNKPAMTLEELFEDYIRHMENHERQLQAVIGNSFH